MAESAGRGQGEPKRQLEVKAALFDRTIAEEAVAGLGAEFVDSSWQLDTYFRVPRGRLKLREFVRGGDLIYYEREESGGVRESAYQVVAVPDAAGMKAMLTAALGVRTVVAKERRLWRYGETRIHVDTVRDLGTFLELEVPVGDDPEAARRTVDRLMSALALRDEDCIRASYADLIEEGAGA